MAQLQTNDGQGDHVLLMIEGQRRSATFAQAFALAHSLYRQSKLVESFKLLRMLNHLRPNDRPTRLLMARGLARLRKFKESMTTLEEIFDEDHHLATQFQDAFISRSIGLSSDALAGLNEIVRQNTNLPTACLMLGDLWAHVGNTQKAIACWQLAAQRDRPSGHVALSEKANDAVVESVKVRLTAAQ